MSNQYVYIFSNELYTDDLLKIGWTKRHPSLRARDLQTSGVPTPFTVEYVIITSNGRNLEKEIHSYLDQYRVSKNREFFKINKSNLHEILTYNMHLNLITIDELDPYLTDNNINDTIPVDEIVRTEAGFPCQRSDNQVISAFLEYAFEPCEPGDRIDKCDVAMQFAQWCENEYEKEFIYHSKFQIVFDAMTEKYGELKEHPSSGWDGVRIRYSMVLLPRYFFCKCGKKCKSRQGLIRHRSKCSLYQKIEQIEMIVAFLDETFEPCEPNPHHRLNKGVVMGLFSHWYRKQYGEMPGNKFHKVFDAMTEKYGELKVHPSIGWDGVRVRVNDPDDSEFYI
jgi:hypothetical protein